MSRLRIDSTDNLNWSLIEKIKVGGENARKTQQTGQGFGLNFAQKICLEHNIGISFESVYLNKDHGVKYGSFFVRLHFDNSSRVIKK